MTTEISPNDDFATARRKRNLRRLVGALIAIALSGALVISAVNNAGETHSVALSTASVAPQNLRGPQLIVHIVGAVKRPGLYSLQNGARVIDAVLRAGGLSKNADDCALNLARLAVDGEQIVVATKPAGMNSCVITRTSSASTGAPGTVSLSRASLGELDALPGIGPGLAQRIIDWRAVHGGFSSVTQLDDVSGIGPRLLEQLTPLVTP